MAQSLAGYIRQHLEELERRMSYGTPQTEIVAELEAAGYKTTVRAFRNYLARARAWRDNGKEAHAKPMQSTPKKPAAATGFNYPGSPDDNELSELI
jgi:hypothetical protein